MSSKFIDYKLKSDVLKTDCPSLMRYHDWKSYDNYLNGVVHDESLDQIYIDTLFKFGIKYINEARKLNNASFRRVERLKDRIARYLSEGQCIWLTLTFSDDVLENTCVETRRKYVSRYLKSISDSYVANIDYGKTTEREHYHALVRVDYVDEKWDYGFTWFEKVHRIGSEKTLAKYISKLTNHAIKQTTKRSCYIYSRSVKN